MNKFNNRSIGESNDIMTFVSSAENATTSNTNTTNNATNRRRYLIDKYELKLLFGVIMGSLCLVTTLGNICVIYRYRKASMVGNLFIISLAVADLIVGSFVMPLATIYTITEVWTLTLPVCQIWLSADYIASTASILNLFTLSLDRYWSITSPLKYLGKRTKSRALLMISLAWSISLLWLIPIVGWHSLFNKGKRTVPEHQCQTEYDKNIIFKIFTAIFNFYVPLISMILINTKIYLVIRKRYRNPIMKYSSLTASSSPSSIANGLANGNGSHPMATTPIAATEHSNFISLLFKRPYTNNNNSKKPFNNHHASTNGHKSHSYQDQIELKCHQHQHRSVLSRLRETRRVPEISRLVVYNNDKSRRNSSLNDENSTNSNNNNKETSCERTNANNSNNNNRSLSPIFYKFDDISINTSSTNSTHRQVNGGRAIKRRETRASSVGGELISNKLNRKQYMNKQEKAFKSLAAIVIGFTVCFTPYFTVFLIVAICENCVSNDLFTVTLWLGYLNSTINPFLYALLSNRKKSTNQLQNLASKTLNSKNNSYKFNTTIGATGPNSAVSTSNVNHRSFKLINNINNKISNF